VRTCIRCPPCIRPIGADHALSALTLFLDGRKKSRPSFTPRYTHPEPQWKGPPFPELPAIQSLRGDSSRGVQPPRKIP
jgi:hypothetical protein